METIVLTCEHLVFSCPMSLSISAGRSGQESPISGSTVKFNVRAILETINTPSPPLPVLLLSKIPHFYRHNTISGVSGGFIVFIGS